jgi:16S rRNA processing protein RimM
MEKVKVGTIVRGFGIKGEVKIKLSTDDPNQRFAIGNTLMSDDGQSLVVRSFRMHQQHALVAFEAHPDLSSVESLAQQNLWVDRSTIDVTQGVYFFELQGARVQSDRGEKLGHVVDVLDYPAHPVLRVEGSRTILIPYVDAFIVSVDKAQALIVVRWMEGL